MAMATTTIRFCVGVLLLVLQGQCSPKRSSHHHRSSPQTVYDQKQSGDYNIQLHLKDFQIIALVGDDSILGDYDYNYDYADFTVKPSTQKPTTGSASPPKPPSTSPPSVVTSTSTLKPTTVGTISTSAPQKPSITTQPELSASNSTKSTKKEPSPTSNEVKSTKKGTNPIEANKTSTPSTVTKVVEIIESSTPPPTDKVEETNSPGQIKVQIIETPIGIVPGEVPEHAGGANHGELLQLRRCAQGFTRDKKGRCRRVRRPSAVSQYGFGRLANTLASRLRYVAPSLPLSETPVIIEN